MMQKKSYETEKKELVLKDLCCRLPYGVVVELDEKFGFNKGTHKLVKELLDLYCVEGIKPYLRSMSSMTEEEMEELLNIDKKRGIYSSRHLTWHIDGEIIDYLNKKMFDWRGLIQMNLALKAPEGMYN